MSKRKRPITLEGMLRNCRKARAEIAQLLTDQASYNENVMAVKYPGEPFIDVNADGHLTRYDEYYAALERQLLERLKGAAP